jgi:hypothetical protein
MVEAPVRVGAVPSSTNRCTIGPLAGIEPGAGKIAGRGLRFAAIAPS